MRFFQVAGSVLLSLLMLVGCGGNDDQEKFNEGLVPVQGTVTVNGKPLEDLQISFIPSSSKGNGNERIAIGSTDAQGKYTAMSPPNGKYIKPEDFPGMIPGNYDLTFSRFVLEDGSVWDSRNSEEGPMNVGATESMPVHLTNANSSRIKATIKKENPAPIDFEIKTKSKR